MNLQSISLETFEKELYPRFLTIFKANVRKSFAHIKHLYQNKNLQILKINDNKNNVGFIIIDQIKSNDYHLLDYLAIYPEYQSHGYGYQALKQLSQIYNNLLIEVEAITNNDSEKEKNQKKRRLQFYTKCNLKKANFNLKMSKVDYYIYYKTKENKTDDEIWKNLIEIYKEILGEKETHENVKRI